MVGLAVELILGLAGGLLASSASRDGLLPVNGRGHER